MNRKRPPILLLKILFSIGVALGILLHYAKAQDFEIGVQYENGGLVPFAYVAQYLPLGTLGPADLYLTPSAELTLSDPLEGWVGLEFLVDTELLTISTRVRYGTVTDELTLRAGILLGGQ